MWEWIEYFLQVVQNKAARSFFKRGKYTVSRSRTIELAWLVKCYPFCVLPRRPSRLHIPNTSPTSLLLSFPRLSQSECVRMWSKLELAEKNFMHRDRVSFNQTLSSLEQTPKIGSFKKKWSPDFKKTAE